MGVICQLAGLKKAAPVDNLTALPGTGQNEECAGQTFRTI